MRNTASLSAPSVHLNCSYRCFALFLVQQFKQKFCPFHHISYEVSMEFMDGIMKVRA